MSKTILATVFYTPSSVLQYESVWNHPVMSDITVDRRIAALECAQQFHLTTPLHQGASTNFHICTNRSPWTSLCPDRGCVVWTTFTTLCRDRVSQLFDVDEVSVVRKQCGASQEDVEIAMLITNNTVDTVLLLTP